MIRFPNAKINIGLYVTNKRTDGYHDLETIFYPLPLCDALEVVPAQKSDIHITGKAVAGDKYDNLIWKAYQLLKKEFPGRVPELDIYLHKVIPMGAGLGGGSSDGAAMLQLVNEFCELRLNKEQLATFALQLGSDCPFFIYNTPQFAKCRGEQMAPVQLDLSAYSIQLICPSVHVSTAEAFKMITPQAARFDLQEINELPIALWKEYIGNDFEMPVCVQHPEIKEIIDELYRQNAMYASMTGSGSAVYGIFEKGKRSTFRSTASMEEVYIK